MNKTPHPIAVVGMSGKGKTMAFRNMNLDTCGYVNAECKPLPFVNKFKHYSTPKTWQETYQKLIDYAKDDTITEVVLDSFSEYVDSLLKTARDKFKNFEIWNFYNDEIGKLLFLVKHYPKDLFIIAHSANVETETGVSERRIAVKGNEWNKAGIEKTFTIVLFADVKLVDGGKRSYILDLNSDGKTTAKTPPMFLHENEETIPNDCNEFLKRIRETLKQ